MKLTDFYTKQKIELKDNINMYVCGPTVYSDPHIGNMRPIIVFDILNKLVSLESNVTFIHNITDVDDKIIAKAIELGVSEKEVATKYTNEYLELLQKLNIKTPTHMPNVTDNIEGIVDFISKLVEKGNAYESNGSVYFSTSSYENYGHTVKSDLDNVLEIEENSDKRNPKDFALWKKTEEGIKWNSPWGEGRPGWHTECSYFIQKYFGEKNLDIHGGGIDLKFPHHINEMAQYETCCNVEKTSKVWSYVGHINFGDEKMSKSLGNIISAKEFIEQYGADTLRMVMLQTSMLNPINLNEDVILNAEKLVAKIKNAIKKALIKLAFETEFKIEEAKPTEEFINILLDDLNLPNALTSILEQVKKVNSITEENQNTLNELLANLELLGFKFEINFNEVRDELKKAKQESNYEVVDQLREEIIK